MAQRAKKPDESKKPIADITINYQDGTSEKMNYYALVGVTEDSWYKIMFSPAGVSDRIKMNNMMAELSNELIASVEKDKELAGA